MPHEREEKSDYLTVSLKYIEEYEKDRKGLNIRTATIHPKATENIDEIKESFFGKSKQLAKGGNTHE